MIEGKRQASKWGGRKGAERDNAIGGLKPVVVSDCLNYPYFHLVDKVPALNYAVCSQDFPSDLQLGNVCQISLFALLPPVCA